VNSTPQILSYFVFFCVAYCTMYFKFNFYMLVVYIITPNNFFSRFVWNFKILFLNFENKGLQWAYVPNALFACSMLHLPSSKFKDSLIKKWCCLALYTITPVRLWRTSNSAQVYAWVWDKLVTVPFRPIHFTMTRFRGASWRTIPLNMHQFTIFKTTMKIR
jgi:hypothetical protein